MVKCHDRADPRYRAILGVLKQYMRSLVSGGANVVRVKRRSGDLEMFYAWCRTFFASEREAGVQRREAS